MAELHAEVEGAVARKAPAWSLAPGVLPGTWRARREAGEEVELRAVHWRAPGDVLDGLPAQENLERLLCAVAARAYVADVEHVVRWLTEINARRSEANRKPASWKAAIHVWLAAVYDKVDELNAANRFLRQEDACKPHVEGVLASVGLLDDLRPLLAPA